MTERKSVGITVLPEYIQSEGVEGVLDRVQQAGATNVTTSPYVMELADAETGCREPPVDAGAGAVRLLDRPLWGARESGVDCSVLFSQYRGGVPGPNAFCSRTLGPRTRVCRVDFEIMSFGSVMTCAGRALRVVSRLPPGPETSKA